tara:strand:+ start:3403 stop:3504 length:102 start_codon:yes stop_codon:yes gene_type:complete
MITTEVGGRADVSAPMITFFSGKVTEPEMAMAA